MLEIATKFMRGKLGFLPYIVIVGLIGTVLFSRHQLSDTRADLKVEQDFRVDIGNILSAPDSKPDSVRQAARAVVKTSESQRVTLKQIDGDTVTAKKRADNADAELKRVQAQNQRDFKAAQPTINALDKRKPSGDPQADQKQLEEDTQAPWKGWLK